MFLSFLLLLVPFIIIFIFLLLISQRGKDVEKRDVLVKNIYIYLVLFATLMMTIGGSVGVFMGLADIVAPAPYYQSFEEYVEWGAPEIKGKKASEIKSEEELQASYEAMIKREQDQQMHRSLNTILKSIGWIIIPLPVFIYFQRQIRHLK